MIPYDKYGHRIYPKTYKILKEYETKLLACGYSKSILYPNLFYKIIPNDKGSFFCDAREFNTIHAKKTSKPLFWWRFNIKVPIPERISIALNEFKYLFKNKCFVRLPSFIYIGDTYNPLAVEDEKKLLYILNYYFATSSYEIKKCSYCGKEFTHCRSLEETICYDCYKKHTISTFSERVCSLCGKKTYDFATVKYHISYSPNIIFFFCRYCYTILHPLKILFKISSSEELSKVNVTTCGVCKRKLIYDKVLLHHISYFPEEVIPVCDECHSKIHTKRIAPELWTIQKRGDKKVIEKHNIPNELYFLAQDTIKRMKWEGGIARKKLTEKEIEKIEKKLRDKYMYLNTLARFIETLKKIQIIKEKQNGSQNP